MVILLLLLVGELVWDEAGCGRAIRRNARRRVIQLSKSGTAQRGFQPQPNPKLETRNPKETPNGRKKQREVQRKSALGVKRGAQVAVPLVFLLISLPVQRQCVRHGAAGSVLPVLLLPSVAGVELSHKYTTYDGAGSQEENGKIWKELAAGVRRRCYGVSGGAAWPGSARSPGGPWR